MRRRQNSEMIWREGISGEEDTKVTTQERYKGKGARSIKRVDCGKKGEYLPVLP